MKAQLEKRFICVLVLTLGQTSIGAAAEKAESGKDQSAEGVYTSLVRPGEAGMTKPEVEAYLKKYDPRYSDPRFQQFAKTHKEYKAFLAKALSEDADKLLSNSGVKKGSQRVVTEKAFVAAATTAATGLKKAPPADYLSNLTGGFLTDSNLSITKSTTIQGDEKRPAQFSWTHSKTGSFFTIDAAITYKWWVLGEAGNTGFGAFVNPSVEAHTSSQAISKRQQDSLSAKVPIELDFTPASLSSDAWFIGHTFLISPDYERDRKKDVQTFGMNVLYSPTLARPIKTGEPITFSEFVQAFHLGESNRDYPLFRWRPYIGFENGYLNAPKGESIGALQAYGNERDYSRFVITLHGDLYITPSFDIAADFSHRTFLTGGENSFDYVELSPILYLDGSPDDPTSQHFSIGMTLKNGKTTPQFKNVNSISAWLGIKF